MASSLGALIIELAANTGKFETDMGRAARAAEKRAKEINKHVAGIGRTVVASLGAAVSYQAIRNSIQLGDELAKAANKSGIAAKDFTELAYAARSSDIELAALSTSIRKMQIVLAQASGGSKGAVDALRGIGFTLEELSSLSPDKQFERIGDAIGRIENPAVRAKAAVELFGKAGADLLPLFSKGAEGIRQAREEAVALGRSFSEEQLAKFEQADDAFKRLNESGKALASVLSLRLAPALAAAADSLRILAGGATELEKVERKLEFLREAGGSLGALNLGFDDKLPTFALPSDIEKRIAELEKRRRALSEPLRTHNRGARLFASGEQDSGPSGEFLKLSQDLEKQIALHGKVGKAAELAYRIQIGAIEGLSEAEGKQLVALAKRYDAMVEAAAAQEAASESARASRDALASMVEALNEQVSTYGLGAEAALEYKLAHGELGETIKLAGEEGLRYAERLRELTAELERKTEATRAAEEAERKHTEIMAQGAAVFEATRTPLEKYQGQIERLNELLLAGSIDADTYGRAIAQARDALDEAGQSVDSFQEQFKDGIFRSLSDGIYTAMRDGSQRGWEGFRDAAIQTIQRILADQLAKKLAELILGGGSGGGGGVGSFISSIFGGGRAVGGPVDPGKLYRINEREPEFFVPRTSGQVIPLSRMPQGGGVRVTQNINVSGRPDPRTSQQLAIESARRLRVQTARLGA